MAAVLNMLLKNAGHDVTVESAGIGETAGNGGSAAFFAVATAGILGLDISNHQRRRTTSLDLKKYDLIICASDEIAGTVIEQGANMKQVYNVAVANPWPVQFLADYEPTFLAIITAMGKVVLRYFPTPALPTQAKPTAEEIKKYADWG